MDKHQRPTSLPTGFSAREKTLFNSILSGVGANSRGLNNYHPEKWPLLHQMAAQSQAGVDDLKWLWSHGVPPLSRHGGASILHWYMDGVDRCADSQVLGLNLEKIRLLISKGVDPKWSTVKGDTALHVFSRSRKFFWKRSFFQKKESEVIYQKEIEEFYEIMGCPRLLFKKNSKDQTAFSLLLESEAWVLIETLARLNPSSLIFSQLSGKDLEKYQAPLSIRSLWDAQMLSSAIPKIDDGICPSNLSNRKSRL